MNGGTPPVFKPWSTEEDEHVIKMYTEGAKRAAIQNEMMEKYGRTNSAVEHRIHELRRDNRMERKPPEGYLTVSRANKLCGNCKWWRKDNGGRVENGHGWKVQMGTCSLTGDRVERCDWCNREDTK